MLAVVLLNYRRSDLVLDCLASLAPEVSARRDRQVLVVDNDSGDGSAERIEEAVAARGWSGWARVVRALHNGGFGAGLNLGIRSAAADAYLLLNSDTLVRPGALDSLEAQLAARPDVGAVGPRLEWPDGAPQVSCFRVISPLSELLRAARTGPLDRLFRRRLVAMGVFDRPVEPEWLSYACVLVRARALEEVGLLDAGYFMYFEDVDHCRRLRAGGWRLLHEPAARVVHLRGGSSPVKGRLAARERVPAYYWESRSRYFARYYGGAAGVLLANVAWSLGHAIALARSRLERRATPACRAEAHDIWRNWRRPLRVAARGGGGPA